MFYLRNWVQCFSPSFWDDTQVGQTPIKVKVLKLYVIYSQQDTKVWEIGFRDDRALFQDLQLRQIIFFEEVFMLTSFQKFKELSFPQTKIVGGVNMGRIIFLVISSYNTLHEVNLDVSTSMNNEDLIFPLIWVIWDPLK